MAQSNVAIRFRWLNRVAIFLALVVTGIFSPAIHAQMTASLDNQAAAVHQERQTRTPVEKKIHSQLLFAARQAAGLTPVPGAPGIHSSIKAEADGRFEVRITATVSPGLLAAINALGGTVLYSYPKYHSVYAFMPAAQLETLAARADVVFIGLPPKPNYGGQSQGAASGVITLSSYLAAIQTDTAPVETSVNDPEGDATHGAAIARKQYGVTGAGVKVGVLSDNINDSLNIYGTALQKGYIPPINVPSGQAGGTTQDGEGLAMLEVVHRIAPGSTLYFASGGPTEEQMAANIETLQSDGCKVICDDIFYSDENPFQDGVIAQAVDEVTSKGSLYFSCAYNDGNLDAGISSCWEGNFVSTENDGFLDFDVATSDQGGVIEGNEVLSGNSSVDVILFWAEPVGGATSQYNLYEVSPQGNFVQESDDDVAQSGEPIQFLSGVTPGDSIEVELAAGSARYLHVDIINQNSAFYNVATAGHVRGHNACDAANSFSVAATPAHAAASEYFETARPSGPYPNEFKSTDSVEPFSDDGPRRMFFTPNGTAITPGNFLNTGGKRYSKPDFTAADGVNTSDNDPNFGNPFFGTSCATPHAAAMAALAWSYNPSMTPTQLAAILRGPGALPITNPGPVNRDAGAGILMAPRILAAVAAQSAPSITGFSPASGPVGTDLTITGANFSTIQSVEFGGNVFAAGGTVNATHIYTTIPKGAKTGRIKVTTTYGSVTTTTNFTVTASVTYTVTPSAGAGGAISPNTAQKVAGGGSVTFTATPNPGYAVDEWLLNGAVAQVGSTSYTATNITANDTVKVIFSAASTTAKMVTPVPGSRFASTSVTFKWSAASGASDYDLYVGTSAGASNIFNAGILPPATLSQTVAGIPKNGATIYVTLWTYTGGTWKSVAYTYLAESTATTYTVTPGAGPDGVISPNTAQKVASGGSITFTATPDPGDAVNQWLLNGKVAQNGSTTYTVKDVTSNDTVKVTFIAPP